MTVKRRKAPAAWQAAARAVARWLERGERLDAVVESALRALAGAERARAQQLVLSAVRHFGRLDAAQQSLIRRTPRPMGRAVLLVMGGELLAAFDETGSAAKIVHHAVEQAKALLSPAEARMVNAVGRKLADRLAAQREPAPEAGAAELAEFFSHPAWLVKRWLKQFGAKAARALLAWNQTPGMLHARWRPAGETPASTGSVQAPEWFRPTAWPEFFEVPPGRWDEIEPLLAAAKIYLQDPSTRLAVDLLAPQAGETILDACAAPGGKTLFIADRMSRGRIVAMDLPGTRWMRLKENLARLPAGVAAVPIEGDLRQMKAEFFRERDLPENFSAVLLDVPCSNTGVMRHRVDVKWRLRPGDFVRHASQQRELLAAAARFVAQGGRLVYSTCSLDPEENEKAVEAFLAKEGGRKFALDAQVVNRPWENGCDGAGVFRLRRKSSG
ncbi:MAG: RsmB/NOP family class I SAM-dependent RNA methyltransferase [Verrucomicrobiota bacterium]|nr:RsmB/NOP family class I SAM-dependent RNA methyltransferase [Verrucomicrobiota bacterium]